MRAADEEDPEIRDVESGLHELQQQGGTRRCLQMVIKRLSDLSPSSRAEFDGFLRYVKVPGFRMGKARAEHLPGFAASSPRFDRQVFRQVFSYWTEIYTGLPETVIEVATKVAPSIDFATGPWMDIAGTAPAISSRMARHAREEVLVALFAHRFGPVIDRRRHAHREGSSDESSDDEGRGASDGPGDQGGAKGEDSGGGRAQTVGLESGHEEIRGDAEGAPQPVDGDASRSLDASFAAVLSALETTVPSSAIWDKAVSEFIERVHILVDRKRDERATVTPRDDLARGLGELQKQDASEELGFLGLRDQSSRWSATRAQSGAVRHLTELVTGMIADLEAHRTARVASQRAANDEDFEAQTTSRREAKRRLLEVTAKLDAALCDMDGPGGIDTPPPPPASSDIGLSARDPTVPTPPSRDQGAENHAPAEAPGEAAGETKAVDDERSQPPSVSQPETVPSFSEGAIEPGGVSIDRASEPAEHRHQLGAESTVAETRSPDRVPQITADVISSLRDIPAELASYAEFRDHYWLGGSSVVEPAPWHGPSFVAELVAASRMALGKGPGHSWELLICARALEALEGAPPIATVDIRAAASLWLSPGSPSAGFDGDRSERLRSGRVPLGSASQRIALVLEALRPSGDRQLLSHEVEPLVHQAEFESGALRVVVQKFLTAYAQRHDPLTLLRRSKRPESHQAGDMASRLLSARRELQALITRVWSAAGGRIERTHCRRAWNEFIDRVHPSLVRLYPPPRGDDSWLVGQVRQEVDAYDATLDGICDQYEAKFDDKRRMLRTAGEIADAARNVIELRREQTAAEDGGRRPFALPQTEIDQLEAAQLDVPDEEWARVLLLRVLGGVSEAETTHPLAVTVEDLCRRPDLLRLIENVPPESIEALRRPNGAFAYSDDLPEAIRAAAVLMTPGEPTEAPTLDTLVLSLERSHRSPLLGVIVQALDDRLQRRVHTERTDALGRLGKRVSEIGQDSDDLAQLGNRFAVPLRSIRDAARAFVEGDQVKLDTRLAEAWLERVHQTGRQLVSEHVAQLSAEAARREDGPEIGVALAQGYYGRAVRLLRGHAGTELPATRQTEWRDAAEANRATLEQNLEAGTDPKLKALLDAWKAGVKGDSVRSDRTLRTEFSRLITDGRDMDRESAPAYIGIPTPAITAALTRDQVMPTWMPQLARFSRVVVLTPPVSPEQPSFRHTTLVRAVEFPQDLVVFLAPRLPAARREEILTEMRRRGTAGAVVDDVDLLRLLNPGGQRPHLMLGLLEIVWEQQRRQVFSPFDVPEGSHVRLEMYVGRRDKARELARTANYSRVFSGRKLGKSSLLRFIERTEGDVKLPSGNALRVVYVPAVGVESEAGMVDAIVTGLETGLSADLGPALETEPAAKLGALLGGYLERHRSESLLVFLDEADVFVERQLVEYEERRERCLSFQMRSRFSAITDEQGLPRVRFVFAGYRVTNRSQGAWSNWGRVLSLDPLEPEDAARLISAPLAVMGIDISGHAHEIAYRCGYQPAILLRFGERLMSHLEGQHQRPGERYVVTASDVSQVLDDPRVHEEIRTIARNNFEGNPVGLIVFGALLRELLEIPPGQPLRDAPQRIIERLISIDPDLSWLEREGDGSATVRGYLSDFVERSLLRERRLGGEPAYALRFPHHLAILSGLADEARVREELRRLKSRSEGGAEHGERGLVSPRILRDLGDASQAGSGAVAIVGTLWPNGTYDSSGGIPDRLSITGDETADAQEILDAERSLATVRAVRRVDVPTAEHILSELHAASVRPALIGGIDLLRWAAERRRSATDLLYEVHGIGRLSMARLTWWLQRVRGIEFARTDGVEQIHARTGGMPVLLEIVDSQLANSAGTTVSDERVKLALTAVDEAIPRIARDLVSGRPAIALGSRERDILRMIEAVIREDSSAGLDLRSALTELWELFGDKISIAPLGSEDAVPLEVLLEVGLLPVKPSAPREDPLARLGPLPPTDPLLALIRSFPTERR
jgi:hypothetical protein